MRFTDTDGREWVFTVDVFHIQRCKRETGVHLAKLFEPEDQEKPGMTLGEVIDDPVLFFDVCCSLLQDQMKSRDVSAEELGKALGDEERVAEAVRALIDGIIEFFPERKRRVYRAALSKIWKLGKEKQEILTRTAETEVEGMDFEKLVSDAFSRKDTPIPGKPVS